MARRREGRSLVDAVLALDCRVSTGHDADNGRTAGRSAAASPQLRGCARQFERQLADERMANDPLDRLKALGAPTGDNQMLSEIETGRG